MTNEARAEAAELPRPVLVYDRVATNKRHSRLLVIGLGLLLVPLIISVSSLLTAVVKGR